jgi:predicted dienelactone hydrolase
VKTSLPRPLIAAAAVAAALLAPALAHAELDFEGRGPHAVGLRVVTLTKASETTGAPRNLETYIWYPAKPNTGTPQGNARRDADVLSGRWPLILFSHGSCGIPNQSPFYTEALASWGFIVAAPSHPGNTTFELPGCSAPAQLADSFANRVADVRFVTDTMIDASRRDRGSPFYQHVDADKIGVSGHSFGGQTTLRVAAEDPRIDGAVPLAPAVGPALAGLRITVPTLVMGAELDSLTPFETAVREGYALLRGPRYLVEILNAGHCAFAIACGEALCGAGCEPGTASLEETHRLTLRYAVPFFLQYVAKRGRYSNSLLPAAAPEGVSVEAAVPSPGGERSGGSRLPALRR